jgi:tryptophan synthase alpha chain
MGAFGMLGVSPHDLGPEEDCALRARAVTCGLDIVRLATPTTDETRLPAVLDGAGGFLYYVSVAGVTGTKTFTAADVSQAVCRIRQHSALPVAVGFGIRTAAQAAEIARIADAAVVGSAIVTRIEQSRAKGGASGAIVEDTLGFCRSLADAVHDARR